MRIDIGNDLKYYESFAERTLPKESNPFESVFSEVGRGQLIEAFFEFDSEKVFVQIKLNNVVVAEIDVENLKDFFDVDDVSNPQIPSIGWYSGSKVLFIKFPMPVNFVSGIEFLAKTNDGNKTKKLKGYQIVLNKENE